MTGDERVNQVLRIPPELRTRLKDSARAHGVSVNWLAEKALTDFLDRLLPPEEVRWTRPLPTPPLPPLQQQTGGNAPAMQEWALHHQEQP